MPPRNRGNLGAVPPPPPGDALEKSIRSLFLSNFIAAKESASGRKCFFRCPVTWDGGKAPGNKTYQNVWKKIAVVVRNAKIQDDLERFIRAQFVYATNGIPTPNQLTTIRAVEKYRKYISEDSSTVAVELAAQDSVMRVELPAAAHLMGSYKAALRFCLMRQDLSLSPLYRYTLARRERLDDVANFWKEAALRQYRADRGSYDQGWGEVVPLDLREVG